MNEQPVRQNTKKIAVVMIPILFAVLATVTVAMMISGNNTNTPVNDGQIPVESPSQSDLPVGVGPNTPTDSYSEGLSFRVGSDGNATLIGIGSCADKIVKIPPVTPDGIPVTAIGDSAFSSAASVTEVILPDSIMSIGAYAFKGSGITVLNIGSAVMSIGDSAFADCPYLTAINVNGANAMFSSQSGVLFDRHMSTLICYPSARPDPSYTIPASITKLATGAFSTCPTLKKLKYEGNAKEWAAVYISSGNTLIDSLTVEVDSSDK